MSIWMIVIGGALIGAALALGVLVMLQPKPRLSAALERMNTGPRDATAMDQPGSLLEVRTASWVRRRMSWIPRLWTEEDRRLVQANENSVLAKKALLALLGFVLPAFFGLLTQFLDLLPAGIPAGVGVIFAVLLWFVPDLELRDKAKETRQEFSQAMPTYLDLIAVEREGGRPPAVALIEAAAVPTSTPFVMISEALNLARLNNEQPWDALHALGKQLGIPELIKAADIVSMAGTEGAAVAHSLRQSARSMRQAQESQDHKDANKNSNKVQTLVLLQAFVFVAIVITPLVMGLK
jgi:Flp pilus assembly protein TadB